MTALVRSELIVNDAARLLADLGRGEGRHSFLVTGCVGGEGATTLAIALARAARKLNGAKALLIDADLAKSGLTRLAGSMEKAGLRQLRDKPDLYPNAVIQVGSDLDILPAGSKPGAGMSELVAAGALEALLSAAFRDYRYVFWDTHALGRSADTGLLMTVVTGVILVTESDVTRMDHLSSRLAEIANARAHAVAVLRNRAGRRPFSAGP